MKDAAIPIGHPHHARRLDKVIVYRIDPATRRKVPVGRVLERRRVERGRNALDLLRLAMMMFPSSLENPHQYILR